MRLWTYFHRAHSLQDALHALANASGPARPIAGGTDLFIDLQQGRHSPIHTLVDVTRIPEMSAIDMREDSLYIGAAVPLSRLIHSAIVQEHAQALVEASELIGGPQVRNTATLGGNVAHALPAADGTIALLALDARVEVASMDGCRQVPIGKLFLGPGKSVLDLSRELIVGFHLPLMRAGQASSFKRVMRPQGVALPILNLATWLHRDEDLLVDIRLALGPAGPTPQRAYQTEAFLREQGYSGVLGDRALDVLLGEVTFRNSPHRASAEYRQRVVSVLLTDALKTAWVRAG